MRDTLLGIDNQSLRGTFVGGVNLFVSCGDQKPIENSSLDINRRQGKRFAIKARPWVHGEIAAEIVLGRIHHTRNKRVLIRGARLGVQ